MRSSTANARSPARTPPPAALPAPAPAPATAESAPHPRRTPHRRRAARAPASRQAQRDSHNRHAHRGGRATTAPGQRHAGAAQHHRAGKHQLAGQITPPRRLGRIRTRHAQRVHPAPISRSARNRPSHAPPAPDTACHPAPPIKCHHSRSDSPPIIPPSRGGTSASRVARARESALSARVGMRKRQRWLTDQAATISHHRGHPGRPRPWVERSARRQPLVRPTGPTVQQVSA